MRGVARDVHAIFGIELTPLDEQRARRRSATASTARLDHDRDRGRGALPALHRARASRTCTVGPSPLWLKARLHGRRASARSRTSSTSRTTSMHDLGSPLHAYDHARIRGARADGAPRARRRDAAHARRAGARARPDDARDRRRRGPAGHRRASWAAPTPRSATSTTTIVLEAANFTRGQILRTIAGARPAHRGVEPLGEGRRPASSRRSRIARRRAPARRARAARA